MRAQARFLAFEALRTALSHIPAHQGLSYWMEEATAEALAEALDKASAQLAAQPPPDDLPQRLRHAAALLASRVPRTAYPIEHDVWSAFTDAGIEGPMRKRAGVLLRLVTLGQRSASGLSEWIESSYCGTVVARLQTTADVCERPPAEVLRSAARLLREKFLPSEVLDEKDLSRALEDSGGSDEARTAARAALAVRVKAEGGNLAPWLDRTTRRDVAKALDDAAEALSPAKEGAAYG